MHQVLAVKLFSFYPDFNMGDSLKDIRKKEGEKLGGETLLPPVQVSRTKYAKRKATLKDLKLKQKQKKERRKIRDQEGGEKKVPKTIESCREPDSTVVDNNASEEIIEEIHRDLETDELSTYFNKEYEPKVLITFSENPIKESRRFASLLTKLIPNSMRMGRKGSSIKSIVKDAIKKNFSDVIILNEDRFKTNGLLLIHLPEGPTAYFRLSNIKLCSKKQLKEMTDHRPEVILNNFNTRLGQTVGRMLGAVFHYQPDFKSRRVVTFHNQRDYIFFRHHRYKFLKGKPALRELGPRFTLKLQSLQRGTFDSKFGEYEWNIVGKRHQMETSRRRFFL